MTYFDDGIDGIDVVTGGAGFIGSHLVDALVESGRRVRVIDNFVTGSLRNLARHHGNRLVEIIDGDIGDRDLAYEACRTAERVFHLAARAEIVPSIEDPEAYFRSNVDGTLSVLEAARRSPVRRFVYIASSSCYGLPSQHPTPETSPIDCRYPYALTKCLGEQLVMHWTQVYRLPAISLRLFNVYGPRARTSGTYGAVFGVFLAQLLANQPLTIVGDGTQTRDFTFVTDVVRAILAAANSQKSRTIYNVGSGAPASINELIRLLGSPAAVNIPRRPGEPDCTWADISKIQAELGWQPRISLSDGVRAMLTDLEYWRDAPVWTVDKINAATASWFRYLGTDPGS